MAFKGKVYFEGLRDKQKARENLISCMRLGEELEKLEIDKRPAWYQ